MPGFQRHDVVEVLRHEDLLLVVLTEILNLIRSLKVRAHVASVNLRFGTNGSLNRPTHMKSKVKSRSCTRS